MSEIEKKIEPYCILPWVHMYASVNGKIYPCCFSSDSEDGEFQRTRTLVSDSGASDFASQGYRELRNEFLQSIPPKYCEACTSLEKRGGFSRRLEAKIQFAPEFEVVRNDPLTNVGLRHAQFSIGNECNLKCRMCNPNSSNRLLEEWKQLGFLSEFVPPSSAYESEEFWEKFFLNNPNLNSLVFAGGETLLTPRILWVIDFLIQRNLAQKIHLELHSNFTYLPDDLLEKLAKFKKVKLMASIEGYQRVNSYIRFPAKWDIIEKNLKRFDALSADQKFQLSINITIQAYNILNIVELFQFAFSLPNLFQLKVTLLTQPKELQLVALPFQARVEAARRIRKYLDLGIEFPDRWKKEKRDGFVGNLKAFLPILENEEESGLLPLFLQNTKAVDRYRGHSINQFLPDLVALIPELAESSAYQVRVGAGEIAP